MNSVPVSGGLTAHPDRIRWNNRYQSRVGASAVIPPAELLDLVTAHAAAPDPVLELAGGPSGTALALAEAGRRVTVVDISDTALAQLAAEAQACGVTERLTLVHADLSTWAPPAGTLFELVLCRFFWDAGVFRRACDWTAPGGLLAWEAPAFVPGRPVHGRPEWCLQPGEPASLLPGDFTVVAQKDLEHHDAPVRRLVAQRAAAPVPGTSVSGTSVSGIPASGSEDRP